MTDQDLQKFLHRTMGARTAFGLGPSQKPTEGRLSSKSESRTELKADADYALKEQLGRGGMGLVYRARQPRLEREVAVKTIRPELAGSEAVESFICEARVTGHLAHPNIVPVIDIGTSTAGETYLAMKLVEGQSWAALLSGTEVSQDSVFLDFDDDDSDDAPLPEAKLRLGADLDPHLDIFLSVCNAIAFAHSRGFLHRDIKPANVMIGAFGEVLVMDWGLAVDCSDQSTAERPSIAHKNEVTTASGTPCFLAPEMAAGDGASLGPWTDVFLLGATLHEVITGQPPHLGDSLEAVIRVAQDPAPLVYDEAVPQELQNILRKAMAKAVTDRFQSVLELRDALKSFQKHGESLRLSDAAQKSSVAASELIAKSTLDVDRSRAYALFGTAIASFDQALSLWPDNQAAQAGALETRLSFARAAFSLGDLALARAQLEGIENARARELHTKITESELSRQNATRTAKRLRRGVALASLLLIAAIAVLALRWDDIQRGREEAERARIEALLQSGFYELGEGSDTEAIKIFEEAVATSEPTSPEAVAGLVLTYIRSSKFSEAQAELDRHAPEVSDPIFGWLRVELLMSTGEVEAAEALATDLDEPTDALSFFIVGVRLSQAGHRYESLGEQGNQEAARAAQEAYADSLAYLTRAMLYSESLRALYVFNRAHSAGHAQDFAAVKECVDLMTNRFPESPHAWFWAGFAYERLDDQRPEALRYYAQAQAIEPENARYNFCVGTASLRRDNEAALRFLSKANELHPNDAETLCNLGQAYQGLGRYAEAVEAFKRGHAIGLARGSDWTYPSKDWLAQAERMRAHDEELLPGVLDGSKTLPVADLESMITLQFLAELRGQTAPLTEAYRQVLQAATPMTHPNVFFRAACVALAASVVESEPLQSRKYRDEALIWLQQSLGRCEAAARAGYMPKDVVHDLVSGALKDQSLDPIRAGKGLESLSDSERATWTKLWNQAEALLKALSKN